MAPRETSEAGNGHPGADAVERLRRNGLPLPGSPDQYHLLKAFLGQLQKAGYEPSQGDLRQSEIVEYVAAVRQASGEVTAVRDAGLHGDLEVAFDVVSEVLAEPVVGPVAADELVERLKTQLPERARLSERQKQLVDVVVRDIESRVENPPRLRAYLAAATRMADGATSREVPSTVDRAFIEHFTGSARFGSAGEGAPDRSSGAVGDLPGRRPSRQTPQAGQIPRTNV